MEIQGRQLGCYELQRVLGSGTTGTVYWAQHRVIKSHLAIKVLHAALSTRAQAIRRFFADARAVNLIGHDNIVKLFDVGTTLDGEHYIAMEYLTGDRLSRDAFRSLEDAQPILFQVMDALAALHEHGFVHRDLKPENIRLARADGPPVAKILDFEIASLFSEGDDPRPQVASPFLAPEQVRATRVSDHRSDVYALGAILFWIATGRVPFDPDAFATMVREDRLTSPPRPSAVNATLSKAFDAMILRALAPDPALRYQTIRDLRAGFELAVAIAAQEKRPSAALEDPTAQPGVSTETLDLVAMQPPVQIPNLRSRADLEVVLMIRDLASFRRMYSMDIAHHGMFIATMGPLPPLGTLIDISIRSADDAQGIVMSGRVVRHVTAEDALAFGGKQGMAMQLLDLDQNKKSEIERMIFGERRAYARRERTYQKNPKVERLIERCQLLGANPGPYNLLQILPGASSSVVREAVHRLTREADPDVLGAMTDEEFDRLSEIRERLEKAGAVLLDPKSRAAHDGASGNFLGVAQALSDGLSVEDLAHLRRQFLATRWDAAPTARAHVQEGMRAEYQGRMNEARTELERALQVDPLDLEIHNLYWALRHKMETMKAEP
jgi:serine/threonine-protein kinase